MACSPINASNGLVTKATGAPDRATEDKLLLTTRTMGVQLRDVAVKLVNVFADIPYHDAIACLNGAPFPGGNGSKISVLDFYQELYAPADSSDDPHHFACVWLLAKLHSHLVLTEQHLDNLLGKAGMPEVMQMTCNWKEPQLFVRKVAFVIDAVHALHKDSIKYLACTKAENPLEPAINKDGKLDVQGSSVLEQIRQNMCELQSRSNDRHTKTATLIRHKAALTFESVEGTLTLTDARKGNNDLNQKKALQEKRERNGKGKVPEGERELVHLRQRLQTLERERDAAIESKGVLEKESLRLRDADAKLERIQNENRGLKRRMKDSNVKHIEQKLRETRAKLRQVQTSAIAGINGTTEASEEDSDRIRRSPIPSNAASLEDVIQLFIRQKNALPGLRARVQEMSVARGGCAWGLVDRQKSEVTRVATEMLIEIDQYSASKLFSEAVDKAP